MDFKNGIIKFEPNRVWRTYQGGKVLDSIEGKQSSEDSHFPEDWIGSVTEARNPGREKMNEGLSFVRDSDGNRISFRDIVSRDPVYFLGENGKGEGRMDALPLVTMEQCVEAKSPNTMDGFKAHKITHSIGRDVFAPFIS